MSYLGLSLEMYPLLESQELQIPLKSKGTLIQPIKLVIVPSYDLRLLGIRIFYIAMISLKLRLKKNQNFSVSFMQQTLISFPTALQCI